MNTQEMKEKGRWAADVALSLGDEQGSIQDTIAAYRENLIDTLNDDGLSEWLPIALNAYDQQIQNHQELSK